MKILKLNAVAGCALLLACGSQKMTSQETEEVIEILEIEEPEEEAVVEQVAPTGMLFGIQDKADFMQQPYSSWFNNGYDSYEMDVAMVDELAPYLDNVEIKAFMGTWCGDSKRETPRLYKILDAAQFDYEQLELVAVDRSKKKPEAYLAHNNIIRVPTFIFIRDGIEIGRFVEYPRETLEKDILKIVSGQPYKHAYEN